MPNETCPLCEGQGKGLPGYYGTMADMFTLLFAFFVLMFSLATMDPAKLSDLGGDNKGSSPEEIDEQVEEVKKQMEELEEQGITDIDDQPIEEYMDSLIQKIIDENKPAPKLYEIEGELAGIIEEMELDSSEANMTRDVRGTAIELYGDFSFETLSAEMKPQMKQFLDSVIDSFMTISLDKNQIIIEGHSDNEIIPPEYLSKYPSNWELSSARASAVVRYLINKGVNAARLVAHGYAERWPADMTWADMRQGSKSKPIGDNITVETGRSGVPKYQGVELDEKGVPILENISMNAIIDSLNSTPELRRRNRRIKIIITGQPFVDGPERSGNKGK